MRVSSVCLTARRNTQGHKGLFPILKVSFSTQSCLLPTPHHIHSWPDPPESLNLPLSLRGRATALSLFCNWCSRGSEKQREWPKVTQPNGLDRDKSPGTKDSLELAQLTCWHSAGRTRGERKRTPSLRLYSKWPSPVHAFFSPDTLGGEEQVRSSSL